MSLDMKSPMMKFSDGHYIEQKKCGCRYSSEKERVVHFCEEHLPEDRKLVPPPKVLSWFPNTKSRASVV